jgi:hypothetical protein
MTALQCVQNKKAWPSYTADGSGVPLVADLSFVRAAFNTALKYAAPSTRLVLNDYSTGSANAPKTACQFQILADIVANTNVTYSRLGVGFQSHVTARPGWVSAQCTRTCRRRPLTSAIIVRIEVRPRFHVHQVGWSRCDWSDHRARRRARQQQHRQPALPGRHLGRLP